ncbi:hypothetical protein LZ017_04165 [Pelomonas sp. CA6]|uniref:hypothetical protein n=1 Tax=Pelomonas sp. CA6 TaxID=2907999 RepID=UPI001F4B4547|nr:hypothetical protein [Pelomonas sp. CA6]MCH7342572.1 hypothetical protein [Pelomonas sp. CA6]
MTDQPYLPVLQRVGWVLVAVGLVDMAAVAYCIVNGISYVSRFNVFAVLAGVFLLRGSLKAASVIRWLAVFMLATLAAAVVMWPFMQPMSLTRAQLRLDTWTILGTGVVWALAIALLVWVVRELGREPVRAARAAAGRKARSLRIPAAVGGGLVVVTGSLVPMFLGDTASRAKALAAQQAGPGFQYHVTSLRRVHSAQGKVVLGVVAAWNDEALRYVPVQWEEPSDR